VWPKNFSTRMGEKGKKGCPLAKVGKGHRKGGGKRVEKQKGVPIHCGGLVVPVYTTRFGDRPGCEVHY